jgi:hypothetical protein
MIFFVLCFIKTQLFVKRKTVKTEKNTGTIAFRFRQVLLYNLMSAAHMMSYNVTAAYAEYVMTFLVDTVTRPWGCVAIKLLLLVMLIRKNSRPFFFIQVFFTEVISLKKRGWCIFILLENSFQSVLLCTEQA